MGFLQSEQLEALKIDKMIFHVVGPGEDELVLLEEIDPGPFSSFFLDRIKSTNAGIMFDFVERSAVEASLQAIAQSEKHFTRESKALAKLFKQHHGGTASKGVFLVFALSAKEESFYGLIKYDHQVVLSYSIQDRGNAHYPLLQELQDTFVKSPEALQKSAIIRLTKTGGELCVKDRVSPREITQYFRTFLGAQRRHTPKDLTTKLVDIAQKLAKEYSAELSLETKKALRQRLYDVVQTQEGFDPENAEPFLASVFGPLPEDSRLRRSFDRKLHSFALDGESFNFDKEAVQRPPKRRIVTREGIQVIFSREQESSVQILETPGGQTKITITTGGIEENDDFPERNSR